MHIRWLRWLDAAAHFLYTPTMLGSRATRARWHHRIHLIPGGLLSSICDLAEADMSEAEVDEAMRVGEPVQVAAPVGFRCQHMSLTVAGGLITKPVTWCGCTMQPIFP